MADTYPGILFRLKVKPSAIKSLFMQMSQLDINQNGSANAEFGRKPSIAPTNKEDSRILSNRSLRKE